MKHHSQALTKLCAPVKALIKHCTKAAAAIDAAITARARVQAQCDKKRPSAGAEKPGEIKRSKAETKPIFQPTDGILDLHVFTSLGAVSARLDSANKSPMGDLQEPFILRCDCVSSFVDKSVELKAAVTSFEEIWKKSALRANPGRALQRVRGPAEDAAWALVQSIEPLQKCLTPITTGSPDLHGSVSPALFAVAAKTDAAFVEKDGLPALRMSLSGHREVVLMKCVGALKVLGMDQTAPDACMKLAMATLNLSRERCLEICRKTVVWRGRIEPGDVLYIPAGTLTCELVSGVMEASCGKAKDCKDASGPDFTRTYEHAK